MPDINIVDTTMRDGEQKAGIALNMTDKINIFKLLNELNIYQVEAGIPAMGGDEKRCIAGMVELGLKSRVSGWNRMVIEDIRHSLDCKVDMVHISVPCSDIQIYSKLSKNRYWVVENLKRCMEYVLERGAVLSVGLEDASRADIQFLLQIISQLQGYNVTRIRFADTVGIMMRHEIYEVLKLIKEKTDIGIEIHTHNDFGMAVSNSISAVTAGAGFVDCTIGGIGERAGNCNYFQFIKAVRGQFGINHSLEPDEIEEVQEKIFKIIYKNSKTLP